MFNNQKKLYLLIMIKIKFIFNVRLNKETFFKEKILVLFCVRLLKI